MQYSNYLLMNQALKQLCELHEKKSRRIIGLMSGTSVDGLDIAMCSVSGSGKNTAVTVDAFDSYPYPDDLRDDLIKLTRSDVVDPELLVVYHDLLTRNHAGMIQSFLDSHNIANSEVDLIASHGHTFHHAPKHKHKRDDWPNATMQIGDGDQIAYKTGITTISDFRQADIARGGEGAPLAGYGDYLMFGDDQKDRVLINIGGIANLTWLPAGSDDFPPLTYDTGPGNTLMDAVIREYFKDRSYDRNAEVAGSGKVDQEVLRRLKSHWYFELKPPKTTGYETFHRRMISDAGGDNLSVEDLMATLCRFTAETIAEEVRKIEHKPGETEIFISGGGVHNPLLMKHLRELLSPSTVESTLRIGLDPDAKEAVIFAVLANELICGNDPRLHLGKISLSEFY